MSSNSPLIIGGIKLPVDLSPAERAKLKLYKNVAIIIVFNAVLAGLAVIDQGKTISWNAVIVAVFGQVAMTLFNVLDKYYSAQGDIPMSTVVQLAQNEYAAKGLPQAPKLSQNEQALQQTVGQMFDPSKIVVQSSVSPVASPPVQNSNPALVSFQVSQPVSNQPIQNQATSAMPVQQVVQAPVDNHPALDNVPLVNTLPNIAAIGK